jgi:hypothetical protein
VPPVQQTLATDLPAAHVALSVSSAADPQATSRHVRRLRQLLPDTVGVVVGGRGAPAPVSGHRGRSYREWMTIAATVRRVVPSGLWPSAALEQIVERLARGRGCRGFALPLDGRSVGRECLFRTPWAAGAPTRTSCNSGRSRSMNNAEPRRDQTEDHSAAGHRAEARDRVLERAGSHRVVPSTKGGARRRERSRPVLRPTLSADLPPSCGLGAPEAPAPRARSWRSASTAASKQGDRVVYAPAHELAKGEVVAALAEPDAPQPRLA